MTRFLVLIEVFPPAKYLVKVSKQHKMRKFLDQPLMNMTHKDMFIKLISSTSFPSVKPFCRGRYSMLLKNRRKMPAYP